MNEIKTGDCVVLKSGGPLMTVTNLINDGADAACVWFVDDDHAKPKHESFSIVTLKIQETIDYLREEKLAF